jgi:peptidoglycan/LPS O-acetylase OafA/YrhL
VWTISHEFIGSLWVYFLTVFAIAFWENTQARYTVYSILILWTTFTQQWASHFIMGLWIADLSAAGYMDTFKKSKYSCYVVSMLVIEMPNYPSRTAVATAFNSIKLNEQGALGGRDNFWAEDTSIFVFCTAVMFLIECIDILQVVFSWQPFLFLGRISFTMYLFHQYHRDSVQHALVQELSTVTNTQWRVFLIFVISNALLFVESWVLVYLIDDPTVEFSRWFERVVFLEPWSMRRIRGWFLSRPRAVLNWGYKTVTGWISTLTKAVEAIQSAPSRVMSLFRRCESTDNGNDKKDKGMRIDAGSKESVIVIT